MASRTAKVSRTTKETDISLALMLNGGGRAEIRTGIGFFDHMLTAFTVHGGFDLTLTCEGDLEVDSHHTIEDVGIALGCAFLEALGDRSGIRRYGSLHLPMDEALGFAAVDVSGRPFYKGEMAFSRPMIGGYDTDMTAEFFRAFAMNASITLHLSVTGDNDHHKAEALYKAAAHALRMAVSPTGGGVLSTKGML